MRMWSGSNRFHPFGSPLARTGAAARGALLVACALALTFHQAAGAYFMYRKMPRSVATELFARSPKKLRPFEYRKTYTPRVVIQGRDFTKRLPPLDLKPRSPISFDLQLDEFLAECERRIHDELTALPSTDGGVSPTPEPTMTDEPRMLEKSGPATSGARIQGRDGRIAFVRGELVTPPDNALRALNRLAEAVKRSTGEEIHTSGPVPLTTKGLAGVSFILFSSDTRCELTEAEGTALVRYLLEGGFVWVDGDPSGYAKSGFEAAIQETARIGSESPVRIKPIPNEHPIYHCVFALSEGLPRNADAPSPQPLDGVWIGGRLAGAIADRTLAALWNDPSADDRYLAFGVNLVVFARFFPTDEETAKPNTPGR